MRVLILCTGNSARSQMAEGYLRALDASIEVHSAGTEPAARVNPLAVAAMAEAGIDIAGHRPKSVDEFLATPFDTVITVCGEADRNCPAFLGRVGERVHIGLTDPAAAQGSEEQRMRVFREVRDGLFERFREWLEKEKGKE
jgi:arsenate reductase